MERSTKIQRNIYKIKNGLLDGWNMDDSNERWADFFVHLSFVIVFRARLYFSYGEISN